MSENQSVCKLGPEDVRGIGALLQQAVPVNQWMREIERLNRIIAALQAPADPSVLAEVLAGCPYTHDHTQVPCRWCHIATAAIGAYEHSMRHRRPPE